MPVPPGLGVLSGAAVPTAEALLLLVRVPLAGAGGFATAAPASTPLFFWTANYFAFLSRSSLGSSMDTTSPGFRPSWISAEV